MNVKNRNWYLKIEHDIRHGFAPFLRREGLEGEGGRGPWMDWGYEEVDLRRCLRGRRPGEAACEIGVDVVALGFRD